MANIFGGNTGITYEQLQQRRNIADILRSQNSTAPRNVGEGIHAIARALVARGTDRQADKAEADLRSQSDAIWGQAFGSPVSAKAQDPAYEALAAGGGPTKAAAAYGDLFNGAEQQYGLPAGYLERTFMIESGGNPNARNPNSSAKGPFQFIDSTAKQYGLENPFDMGASTDAAARLAASNASILRNALGREPTAAELYLAHQQGAGGAAKLLSNPDERAVDIVGQNAVRLNGGDPSMTAGQFAGKWVNKFGGGSAPSQPNNMAAIAQALSDPYIRQDPGKVAILEAMMQSGVQAQDPLRQLQLQQAQMELDAAKNPKPGYGILTDEEETAMGLPVEGIYQRGPDGKIAPMDVGQGQSFSLLGPQEVAAAGLPPGSYQRGADGKIYQIGGGGTNVTVNNAGEPTPTMGTIPQGYTAIKDDTVEAGYRMVPIPGGPEDTTKNDQAKKATIERSGDVVVEDIGRVLDLMDNGTLPVTGAIGAVTSGIPGTGAHDAAKLLDTIRANVGFDRLQAMRDASPTGGALGAINQSEMTLLNSALGSLEQSQGSEQFRYNLERLRDIYKKIIDGDVPEETKESGMDFSTMTAKDLAFVDVGSLSDEELKAFIAATERATNGR